jgi:hypothetical protein
MAHESRPAREPAIPLVGRDEQLANLVSALRDRQTRLILGPWGAGKTSLLAEAARQAGTPCLCVWNPQVLHELLVAMAMQLGCQVGRFQSPDRATSMALKPAILDSLRAAPRCVLIDGVSNADPRMYRFLQQVYYVPNACLAVAANSRESLGFLRKLLWDPREEIALRPLGRRQAGLLFDLAAQAYSLQAIHLTDFRRRVLAAAHGNPGQIVAMCRLAAHPEYRSGRHIKFLPLRMDVLISQS